MADVPSDDERFLMDLEFLQNLSFSHYLHFLHQHKYFEDPNFMKYLQYLTYWKRPEYVKYIKFPYCLSILDLLLSDDNSELSSFIEQLKVPEFAGYIHQQQGLEWMEGRNKDKKNEEKVVAVERAT